MPNLPTHKYCPYCRAVCKVNDMSCKQCDHVFRGMQLPSWPNSGDNRINNDTPEYVPWNRTPATDVGDWFRKLFSRILYR